AERDLYSDEHSILGRMKAIIKELKDVSKIDGRLDATAKKVEAAFFELEDSAGFLRDYAASLESDPARLEEIEARLHTIEKLKKKYGPTVKEVLLKFELMDARLSSVGDYEANLKTLKENVAMAREEAMITAESLSESRRAKAVELKIGVEKELSELGMKGCVFQVAIETDRNPDGSIRFGEKGAERVNFFIATNPGEGLKSLPRIASGGELSRIMLAIKGLTSMGKVPTLIFDEVDAGIGAITAAVVGRKIKNVSKKHQVICITHLPQVASFADSHYRVEKVKTDDNRTVTRVKKLSAEERVEEIALMLAGVKVSDTTRKQAREMLAASSK
ncbi:MAG: DNA repair protein RecN, partial [Thermodesulfobacteriota bacterium]